MSAELNAELERETHESTHGVVRHSVSPEVGEDAPQLEHSADQYNPLVWDGPAHNEARAYNLEAVSVLVVAAELATILAGQSFGGVVAQELIQLRPSLAGGFISISSQSHSMTSVKISFSLAGIQLFADVDL